MKSNWLVAALFILAFSTTLSGYVIEGDTVTYENQYGKLTQTPHTLNDFNGNVVINATSYFNTTQSLDFALGFVTTEAKPSQAWKWTDDVAHQVPYWCETSHSRQCDTDTFSYNSTYAWCIDDNETVKWEHYYDNGWIENSTIEWFEWERSCTDTVYWDDWTKLNNFNTIDYGGKKWYVVSAFFNPDETKSLKVNLNIQPGASGKYDLFIKRSSDSWNEAFSNGNYVLLDPWFNTTWQERKPINVTDSWNLIRESEPMVVNVTGLSDFNNCSDNRLTWVGVAGVETNLEYSIIEDGSSYVNGTQYCAIQFIVNMTNAVNGTHVERNVTNYYYYFHNVTNVADGTSPDLRGWDAHYNAWDTPVNLGFTQTTNGIVQNYTYALDGNGIFLMNDTVGATFAFFGYIDILAENRTIEVRGRMVSNTTDDSAMSIWVDDSVLNRRGMNIMGDRVNLGHPDTNGFVVNHYDTVTTPFKIYRFVTDNQGQTYTVFEDGVNKTWGDNLTTTLNGAGHGFFGGDWSGTGISIIEIDYYTATLNGYFPPLNYIVGAATANVTIINITVYDEQTGNRIFFDLDVYNSTTLQEFNNVFAVTDFSYNFPQNEVRLDASNTSYYGRSRLIWVNPGSSDLNDIRIYLINATAADVIAVRFHIRTQLGVAIDNATVLVERNIGGTIQTIGELRSDFNGDALFYLEVNAPYYLTVTHSNYDSFFGSVNPSDNDYTITLNPFGANATTNYTSFTPTILDDLYWYLSPFNRRIWNETTNITFFVESTSQNLTYWGMNISNATNSSIYFRNDTRVSGGILYYILNISDFNTSAENITVYLWIHRNPAWNLTAMFPIDFDYSDWLYPHSLIGAREVLYESGLSDVGIAIFVLFITMFIVAWVAKMNPTAGLVIAGIVLSFFAFSGVFDYTNNGVLIVGGIGIFVIALATAISLIYLRSSA